MKTNCVYTKNDWDHEVIDVFLSVDDEEYWIKGFDDVEWEIAKVFAESFAKSLNIEFVGDRTDT